MGIGKVKDPHGDNLDFVTLNYAVRLDLATEMIKAEVYRATTMHSPMTTAHEGKAVIEEELDELWDEVKLFPNIDREALLKEAVHIGAMAARFIADICSVGGED